MSNINVVQSCWNFAHSKKLKKYSCSQNLKSLTQKANIWWHNVVSRRFGKYSFQQKHVFSTWNGQTNGCSHVYEMINLVWTTFTWFKDSYSCPCMILPVPKFQSLVLIYFSDWSILEVPVCLKFENYKHYGTNRKRKEAPPRIDDKAPT